MPQGLPTPYPTCERFGLHPCEHNERIAVLAVEVQDMTGAAALPARIAATQLLTPYDILGNAPDDQGLAYAEARVVLAQFVAAQSQRKAA